MNVARLRQLIVESFSLEELHTLCFDMDVKFDNLPGTGLEAKARDLVALLDRSNRLDELLGYVKQRRQGVDWDSVREESPSKSQLVLETSSSSRRKFPATYIAIAAVIIAIPVLYFVFSTIGNNANDGVNENVDSLVTPDEVANVAVGITDTPPPASTETPTESARTTTPEIMPTATSTVEPIATPTTDPFAIVQAGLMDNCIRTDAWTPYRGQAMPTEADCWQLDEWGIVAEEEGLRISFSKPSGTVERGIYTTVPTSGRVSVEFRIDELDSAFDIEPALVFGFTSEHNPEPGNGRFFLLEIQQSGQSYAALKLLDEQQEQLLFQPNGAFVRYPFGESGRLDFIIENKRVSIFANGTQIGDALELPLDNAVFWIGYQLYETTEIDAFISNITIEADR